MRAALQLALEHESLERAGLLEEEVFRRGHRRDILARAARPMRDALGAAGYERLLKALSVIYGIEIYVVLKDIWGASDREVEAIARWMLEAIVAAALRRGAAGGRREKGRPAAALTRAADEHRPAISAWSLHALDLLEHLEDALRRAGEHPLERLRQAASLERVAAGTVAFGHGIPSKVVLRGDTRIPQSL